MKLTLHPDPGTGHHWRLTLEVDGIELSCDVARRGVLDLSAIAAASQVAKALGLVESGPHEWCARSERPAPTDCEYLDVPIPLTRRARVTLVNRLELLGTPLSRWPLRRQFGPGIDDRLAPGDVVALRSDPAASFRTGFARVRPDGLLDLTEIVAATETDLLYRVEPEVSR